MEQVHFQYSGDALGGIVGTNFDNTDYNSAVPVHAVTLEDVFRKFQVPSVIDYMSLDVEGAEEFIMKHFPLHLYTISILTIERPKPGLVTLLEAHGYKQIGTLSFFGETVWINKHIENEVDLTAVSGILN